MSTTTTRKNKADSTSQKEKQIVFKWTGKNKKGESVSGEVEAGSMILAKALLRKQGIIVKSVKKSSGSGKTGKKIKSIDICIFSRQMATMMSSGIPLIQSFDIVAKGNSNPNMQNLILKIKADVESGNTLAESLSRHPKYFNDLFCNLIAAGEQSGALEIMLDRVATYQEKSESVKKKIKKAMNYPIAVMGIAFIVTIILLIYVVPQFAGFFKNNGAELPVPTQFVLSCSEFVQKYWWLMFGIIGGSIFSFVHLKRHSEKFNDWWDRAILKFPVVGNILYNAIIARFTRTLCVTFAAGLPLMDALKSVGGATGNRIYMKATQKIIEDVSSGQQLQFALKNTNLFPSLVIQMVAIGEESGALEKMLNKVALFYEEAVDTAVDSLSSLLEPIILVFLAVVVGGLVVSMYLPIFEMGKAV